MTSKERIKAAVNHQTPDYIPLDMAGHSCATMHVSCVAALRKYFGLDGIVKLNNMGMMTGLVENDLLEALGCDTTQIIPYGGPYGFPNENWKEWDFFGQPLLVPEKFMTTDNGKGGHFLYPQGNLNASPSGELPKDGFYFDGITRQPDLPEEEDLDPAENLEEYTPISDAALKYYAEQAKIMADEDRYVIVNFGGTGLGDVAAINGQSLLDPKGVRDVAQWYMTPLLYPEYVEAMFSGQVDIAIENLRKIHAVVGDSVDAIQICGADFGTQTGTFFSVDTYRELWLPYHKRVTDWVHANTNWKTMKHSCGAIQTYIPSFIEAGFDILNPVQCSATGMDPRMLKDTFGKDITFWGGGVDTQQLLPFGTPEEIRRQVLERCEIFGKDGGFVFAAIHVIQAGTPVENIIAMVNALKEFNGTL